MTGIYNTPSGDPVKWENNRHKVLQKLTEYEDLEEQGLLKIFPCKVGDKLYQPTRGFVSVFIVKTIEVSTCHNIIIHTHLVSGVNITGDVFSEKEIGKTVFLTQAEAEEALKGMEK